MTPLDGGGQRRLGGHREASLAAVHRVIDPETAVAHARSEARDAFSGVLYRGESPAMQRVRRLIEQGATSDLPVLITGEVGTGKDLVAAEIHARSARRDRPCLELNCASLPEEFFSSPLFDRGVAVSEGATLLLNGLAELSVSLQENLLQLLRRSDAPPAADHGRRMPDIRLIATTHRDLGSAVETGAFSEHLYYRVNLVHIHVPPLRSHAEDIPELLRHFARAHGRDEPLAADVVTRLCAYEWPGNLRELENAIRRLIALGDPAYVLEELEARTAQHLRPQRANAGASRSEPRSGSSPADQDDSQVIDLKKVGREASDLAERQAIVDMLARTIGNKKIAAQRLGISYKALLYKIRDFGIVEPRSTVKRAEAPAQTSSSRS